MYQCEDCHKPLKWSEVYQIKPKYEGEPYALLCRECHIVEYNSYLKHNVRVEVITPELS